MPTSERVRAAQDFLEASIREFDAGENRQASEKLWGASTRLIIAMAEERGWDCGSHRAMKDVSRQLAVEFEDKLIEHGFSIAEKFHRNFYHNFMEDFELEPDRATIHDFVERLLAYHDRC